MLEQLPDVVGHALRGQRAGLDKTVFQTVDLRGGMAAIRVARLAFADHAPIPARYTSDGALQEAALPSRDHDGAGLRVGRNSYLQASWLPPDPPPGHGVHRYAFQVFALEAGASFDGEPGREAVLEAIRAHGLASGCLIGTYERPDTSIAVGNEEGVPAAMPALAV